MPIVRTFACPECAHMMDVTLTMDQVDDGPPECPRCNGQTQQEFKPVAIGGSSAAKAHKIAEQIAEEDYGVADLKSRGEGERAKVRYKDQTKSYPSSAWTASQEALQAAAANGRHTRIHYGDGLDVLRSALKDGSQPDLIAASKRRAMRVF